MNLFKRFSYRTRAATYLGLSMFCFAVLSACTGEDYKAPLRVGTHKWIGYETFYLADKLGYYEDSNIRFSRLLSASDQMHAIRSGNLEVVTLTLDEMLTLVDEGYKDLKVILIIDSSFGGDAVVAKSDIASLSDLKGKTIAVEFTAVGHVMLDGMLEAAGLTLEDVNVTPCTIDRHLECFAQSDAVITFEPYRTFALNEGGKILFDSSQIPNRIIDVLVASKTAIQQNPEAIQALVDGYFSALKMINNDRKAASEIISKRLEMTPELVEKAYDLIRIPSLRSNRELLGGDSPKFSQDARALSRLYANNNILTGPVDTANISDGQFVMSAEH